MLYFSYLTLIFCELYEYFLRTFDILLVTSGIFLVNLTNNSCGEQEYFTFISCFSYYISRSWFFSFLYCLNNRYLIIHLYIPLLSFLALLPFSISSVFLFFSAFNVFQFCSISFALFITLFSKVEFCDPPLHIRNKLLSSQNHHILAFFTFICIFHPSLFFVTNSGHSIYVFFSFALALLYPTSITTQLLPPLNFTFHPISTFLFVILLSVLLLFSYLCLIIIYLPFF